MGWEMGLVPPLPLQDPLDFNLVAKMQNIWNHGIYILLILVARFCHFNPYCDCIRRDVGSCINRRGVSLLEQDVCGQYLHVCLFLVISALHNKASRKK